ncbi:MAG TPA: type II secretion system minor pseudopilin GspK [Casimicrobiaceae bacterium]|nr:type II secretion system minor pseudopilin GspK [Casimicrobiaceae bacterium]
MIRHPSSRERRAGDATRVRGAALILAMLIAALAAAVAVSLAAGQQQWQAGVALRSEQVQAQALAQAGIQWARQIMFEDVKASNIDHLGEPWALKLPATPIENGSIEGRIADAQGMLNVNGLGAPGLQGILERTRFERLFARLGIPASTLDAISDWIDADGEVRPGGAEDVFYRQQPSPALAANAPIVRLAELSVVRGFTPEAVTSLSPYITALPGETRINVNTAPPQVLATAISGLDGGALSSLVESRSRQPFTSIPDFRARLPSTASIDNEGALSVGSDYFLVTVVARQGPTLAQARALLKRGSGGWPQVVWQTIE